MRALQSLALGKITQRVLTKEPKTKEIGKFQKYLMILTFTKANGQKLRMTVNFALK
jgi:hypothetical protein